jgi:hypothetical protein
VSRYLEAAGHDQTKAAVAMDQLVSR